MANEDVLIGYGRVYYAATGTAFPDETSVAWGASWGGSWTSVGDTLEPITITGDREVFDVDIQQSVAPIKQSIVSQTMEIQTTLANHTAENLKLVLLGTITTTAAGASQKAYKELNFGGETAPNLYAVGVEALYKDASNNNQPVRYLFYKASITLAGDINFDKGAATGIPISITVLADTTQSLGSQLGKIQIVTANASS